MLKYVVLPITASVKVLEFNVSTYNKKPTVTGGRNKFFSKRNKLRNKNAF